MESVLRQLFAGVEARHRRSGEGTIGGFAFKPRTNFLGNFVRDLTTKVRDFNAMTLQ
jgi:hypothetical protein